MGVSLSFPAIRKSFNRDNLTVSNSRKFSPAKDSRCTVVEDEMHLDVETTAYQLRKLLTSKEYNISLRTVSFVN